MAGIPTWMKPILGGIVTIGLLGLVEGGLRLAGLPDRGLYDGDLVWAWTLRPGLDRPVPGGEGSFRVVTNSLGLRGDPPPADGPFTLVMGCSTSFGWGVAATEAWPARLAAESGAAVVNGGVPGWSTAQARRAGATLLALHPTRLILAFGVRDAQLAPQEDAVAQPTPPGAQLSLIRLLRGLRPAAPAAAGGVARVSPAQFAENLRALAVAARPAAVYLMVFPQPTPLTAYIEAARSVGPTFAPEMPASAFFTTDPIHLTAAGHAALAQTAAAALSDGRWAPLP